MRLFIISIGVVILLSIGLTYLNSTSSTILSNPSSTDTAIFSYKDTTSISTNYKYLNFQKHKKDTIPPIKDDSNKKYIYLTFDDGPDIGTPIIANILKEENIPGTFFIIGWHVITKGIKMRNYFEDSLLANPFFLCANHSFSHAYFNHYPKFYKDINGGVNDFIRNQDTCKFKNKIVRGPGSNVWWSKNFKKKERNYFDREEMMDSLIKLGYIVVGWDLEWDFTKKQTLKESTHQMLHYVNRFFKDSTLTIPNHLVLLMHDRTVAHGHGADSLRTFIRRLKQHKNYEFRYLSEYPMVREAMNSTTIKEEH